MGFQFTCDKCGKQFKHDLGISLERGSVEISNNQVKCPVWNCSGWGRHAPGKYDFVDGVIAAFTSPGMTKEKASKIAEIVKHAVDGEISDDVALARAERLSSALGTFLKAARDYGITFDRILAAILFVQVFWNQHSSDADAQAALAESRNQTELSQKILSELEAMNAPARELKPQLELQPQHQEKKSAQRKLMASKRKAELNGGTSLTSLAK